MQCCKLKGIFFDVGNTLAFLNYSFIKDVSKEFGVDVDVEKIRLIEYQTRSLVNNAVSKATKGDDHSRWILYFSEILKQVGFSDKNIIQNILEKLYLYHKKSNLWNQLSDDVVETLEYLKDKKYKLGVISNSDGRIAQLLSEIGIWDFFDVVIDSGIVGIEKPNKEIFEIALKEIKLEPSECAYVGDLYEIDIVGAKSAGMIGILIDPIGNFNKADCHIIKKINDIKYLIDDCII